MGDVVDPVQAAVEATFPLFEQHTDIPLLVQQMAEFSAQHIEAFSLISSPAHPRLTTQADNLCAFIRKDCQDLTDLDGYFLLMASFLRDIPISPNVFDEIGREFFSTKFEYLTDDIRRAVLEALAHNLISFNTIGVYHTIAEAKSEPRTPDELSFTRVTRKGTRRSCFTGSQTAMIHWCLKFSGKRCLRTYSHCRQPVPSTMPPP